jgi:adenosylcobyric acid synthase
MGRTTSQQPWLEISQRNGTRLALADGAVAAAGNVWGCYLHGLFTNESLRRAWLTSLGWRGEPQYASPSLHLQTVLDTVASHAETHLDMRRLEAIIRKGST